MNKIIFKDYELVITRDKPAEVLIFFDYVGETITGTIVKKYAFKTTTDRVERLLYALHNSTGDLIVANHPAKLTIIFTNHKEGYSEELCLSGEFIVVNTEEV